MHNRSIKEELDFLDERNRKFIGKKVKVKCKVFGSPHAKECIIYTNLTAIPAGSVGQIIQVDNCPELRTEFFTVKFDNIDDCDASIFAHLNASVFDEESFSLDC